MSAERRIVEMNLTLPTIGTPKYNYVPFKRVGDLVFISGQVPKLSDGTYVTGKVGREVTTVHARDAASICGLYLLAIARTVTGSLDDVEMVKLFGMVNAIPDYQDHPLVIEACSEILVEVMGEKGQHARSAIGVGSLPSGVSVEIEAVFRTL